MILFNQFDLEIALLLDIVQPLSERPEESPTSTVEQHLHYLLICFLQFLKVAVEFLGQIVAVLDLLEAVNPKSANCGKFRGREVVAGSPLKLATVQALKSFAAA
jgi:hypothetical protein